VIDAQSQPKHTDSVVAVPDYTLLRRDRLRRRGGGVAEFLWARVGNTLVGALYHPPRLLYTAGSLLD